MFLPCKCLLLCVIGIINNLQTCTSEPIYPPTLTLHSNEPEYTDVVVRREHENLTLVCEFKGDTTPRHFVWNYVSNATTGQSPYTTEPAGLTTSSRLIKQHLLLSDSGEYMCSSPPFSVTKYLLVQKANPSSPTKCGLGSFACGDRCVMPSYVCDGRTDCLFGEDEDPAFCRYNVCSRSGKVNCSAGRCISISACCLAPGPLCNQPACCDQLHSQLGLADEYPPLFEDRHAPDDYGFIQSTIYTVTACALIFMIAVVLLVSAICKMHMKRAALRGYTHADRAARQHYSQQYERANRFPPCYEASRLLEESRTHGSPQQSPAHGATTPTETQCTEESSVEQPRGLARLSSIFSSRYRQVPCAPPPVELQSVRASSAHGSPLRRAPLQDYRSPTYADLDADLLFADPDTADTGRDLNYMATPIEFFRRRTMRRNTLERVIDQLDRQRLTLQLGRFQLSIPRFGRASPRPDTPNVAEINLSELDFLRLAAPDTYTLNGRTIRLLGAELQPCAPDAGRPPSYTEAVRYKLYGPPPEYLSREGLNRQSADQVDQEATTNVEMPPCYEELNQNDDNGNVAAATVTATVSNVENNGIDTASTVNGDVANGNCDLDEENRLNTATNAIDVRNDVENDLKLETLSSIIDNLPAIDSDVNANETDVNINSVPITVVTGNGVNVHNVISNENNNVA